MSVLMDLRALAFTGFAMTCWMFSSSWLAAQDAQDVVDPAAPLVIVGDGRDAASARQIGGMAISVMAPFAGSGDVSDADYDHCNSRAQALRRFSVYLARPDVSCRHESFWRERLTRENPRGRVYWIASRAGATDHHCQFAARAAIEVHRALVAALPERRQTFDANLAKELARLRRLRFEPVPLATVQR